MVFYKFEFISGIIIGIFGIASLVMAILANQLISLVVIIPITFLAGGIYLIYLAFKEVELDEETIEKIQKN